jgi:hypothetical protein
VSESSPSTRCPCLGTLDWILGDKCKNQKIKGSHLTDLDGDELKLLCFNFILGVCHHSYSEFAAQKIYHSGALDWILDNKLPEPENKRALT